MCRNLWAPLTTFPISIAQPVAAQCCRGQLNIYVIDQEHAEPHARISDARKFPFYYLSSMQYDRQAIWSMISRLILWCTLMNEEKRREDLSRPAIIFLCTALVRADLTSAIFKLTKRKRLCSQDFLFPNFWFPTSIFKAAQRDLQSLIGHNLDLLLRWEAPYRYPRLHKRVGFVWCGLAKSTGRA